MRHLLLAAAFTAWFAEAPLQCASEPDTDVRRYEQPAEALYELALRFRAKHEERAWRETLQTILERFPNSRFAAAAREDLAEGWDGGAAAGRAP